MVIKKKHQTKERYIMIKNILQQQNDRYVHIEDLIRSFVQLGIRK